MIVPLVLSRLAHVIVTPSSLSAAGEWKGIRKDSVDVWAGRFCELLRGGPRTLNALTVEAADATADMAGPNAAAALWSLKAAGVVEHTVDAPVLWRLTGGR